MRELVFEDGRATVDLANGTTLSIINADRNEVIYEARQWSPSYALHGWEITEVQAKEGTYECAIITGDGGLSDVPDENLTTDWILSDGDVIYRNVTLEQVAQYVDEIGER